MWHKTLLVLVASALCASTMPHSATPTVTPATSDSQDAQDGPRDVARLDYQLESVSDGESVTVSESAETITVDEITVEPIYYPAACYNDAVDCANKMKDWCLTRGGVKKVVFESTIEKCSANCNNGDTVNCTKTQYPRT